jgi:serine/threonine protein kinase
MELCEGRDLYEELSCRSEPFPEQEAAKMIEQLLKAVCHCNAVNILHRDIKP